MAEEGSVALSSVSAGGGAEQRARAHRSTLGLYAHAFAALTASRQLLPPPLRAAMLTELDANIEVSGGRAGFLGGGEYYEARLSDPLTPPHLRHTQAMSVLELFGEAAAEPAALWEWLRAVSDDDNNDKLAELPVAPPPPPPLAHADARSLLVGYAVTQGSLRRVLEVVLMLLEADAGGDGAGARVRVWPCVRQLGDYRRVPQPCTFRRDAVQGAVRIAAATVCASSDSSDQEIGRAHV